LGSHDSDLRETGASRITSPEKQFAEILMRVRKKLHIVILSTSSKREIDLHLCFMIKEIGSTEQNTA